MVFLLVLFSLSAHQRPVVWKILDKGCKGREYTTGLWLSLGLGGGGGKIENYH